jgi:glycine hydroxymethyltransferase
MVASGIRLGTPALTTRGMTENEMRQIGRMIVAVINEPNSEEVKTRVRDQVKELTARFSLYPQRYKKQMSEAAIAAE